MNYWGAHIVQPKFYHVIYQIINDLLKIPFILFEEHF